MSSDAFKEHLAKLQAEYRDALPDRLADVDARWEAALRSPEDAASFAAPLPEIHRLLHSLAGWAKTFGLPAVSTAAREAEHFIEPFCSGEPRTLSAADRDRFGALLAALRRSAPGAG